jgi:hypothetical protein
LSEGRGLEERIRRLKLRAAALKRYGREDDAEEVEDDIALLERLPKADRRRILAHRRALLEGIAEVEQMELDELRGFVRDLAAVASYALSLGIEAPDIDADEREDRRDAGEEISPQWEWRETERRRLSAEREAAGDEEALAEVPRVVDSHSFFDGQKHYGEEGHPPAGIRIPGSLPFE